MGTFDPTQFLDQTINQSLDSERNKVPEGEYQATIKDVKVEGGVSNKEGSEGKQWARLDVRWVIDDARVKEIVGLPEPSVKQGIMLDLNDAGNLDLSKQKNIGLGRLREALGLNTPGQPFSFRMMEGRMAKVKVTHREYEGQIFDEIRSVAKI